MRNSPISLRRQNGQSLIEVMISIVIMGLMMAALATMMASQSKMTKSLGDKLAVLDFQQQLTRTFSDGTVCTQLLNTLTFDSSTATPTSTSKPVINLAASSIPISAAVGAPALISAGSPLSPLAPGLTAAAVTPFSVINIVGTNNGTTGTFRGEFVVRIDNSTIDYSLRSPASQITIQTTSAGTTETITGCQSANASTQWVQVPATGTVWGPAGTQAYQGGADLEPQNICISAGFANYTGSCRGTDSFGRRFQGSVIGSNSGGVRNITCWYGYPAYHTDQNTEILCTK